MTWSESLVVHDPTDGTMQPSLSLYSLLGNLFHFPDKRYSKSEPYVLRRQRVTLQYGNLMAAFLIVFVLCIPVFNTLRANRYWVFNRIHILRSTNTALERLTRRSLISDSLAARIRNLASTVYLNHGTAFQIGLWCTVFVGMCSVNICGGDLIFLGKRLGRLCVVSLPTVFFLTLRPSPLPSTLYLSLLPIHKWLSRVVVLLAVLHTIIYCAYFLHNNNIQKAWKPANLYGWVAMVGFIFLALTSLLRVRDGAYRVFFCNHYFWSWVIVLCLPFHVRPVNTTYANIANVLILSYQVFTRVRMTLAVSARGDVQVIDVSPNMAVIEFPNLWIKERGNNPGTHIRITNWHPNIFVRIYKFLIPNYHPYTLVTLPLDRYQRLVVRKGAFVWDSNQRYISYGTFDPKLLFIESKNTATERFSISKLTVKAKKLLIVVGGSAISFAIPILRVANYHGIPIKVVWVLRDYRDLSVLKCFEGIIHGDEFEIFVTGATSSVDPNSAVIQNSGNYGTFGLSSKAMDRDLERGEMSRLISEPSDKDPNLELENVDVDFIETEDVDEVCNEECQNTFSLEDDMQDTSSSDTYNENENGNNDNNANGESDPNYNHHRSHGSHHSHHHDSQHNHRHNVREHGVDDYDNHESGTSFVSRKSSTSGFNEQFMPYLDDSSPRDNDYLRTVQSMHLEHRIYRGRPVLNFRYYNWCLAANDTFTQCSGPVLDAESNLVCCKDLPGRRHSVVEPQDVDLGKVWVISAGPKSLVKNTRLWANENGLNYHEEAFYV